MAIAILRRTSSIAALILLIICIFILPILIIQLIHLHIPFYDERDDNIIIYFSIIHHHFHFSQLLAHHNAHRVFLARLIYIINYFLFPTINWFVNAFNYLLLLGAWALLVFNFEVSKKHLTKTNNTLHHWMWLLLAILIFSPHEISLWSWSYLIVFGLTTINIIAAIFCLNRFPVSWLRFNGCVIFSCLATLSSANALMIWPICLLMLLFLQAECKKTLLYVIIAAIIIPLYTHGYQIHYIFNKPLESLHYFFLFLGNMYAILIKAKQYTYQIDLISGITIFLLFISLSAYCILKFKRKTLANFLPWISLGLFALANAAIASVSRLNGGIYQSLSYRYTAITCLLYISVIALVALNFKNFKPIIKTFFIGLLITFLFLLSLTFLKISNLILGNNFGSKYSSVALSYKVLLPFNNDIYPNNAIITNKLIRYEKSNIYSRPVLKNDYLNKKLQAKNLAKLGLVVKPRQFSYLILQHRKEHLSKKELNQITTNGFNYGFAFLGELNTSHKIKIKHYSPTVLLLNNKYKVIGIAKINYPIALIKYYLGKKLFYLHGFVLQPEKIDTLVVLNKDSSLLR